MICGLGDSSLREREREREQGLYVMEKKISEREKTINNGKLIFLKYNIEFAIRVYTNELI